MFILLEHVYSYLILLERVCPPLMSDRDPFLIISYINKGSSVDISRAFPVDICRRSCVDINRRSSVDVNGVASVDLKDLFAILTEGLALI